MFDLDYVSLVFDENNDDLMLQSLIIRSNPFLSTRYKKVSHKEFWYLFEVPSEVIHDTYLRTLPCTAVYLSMHVENTTLLTCFCSSTLFCVTNFIRYFELLEELLWSKFSTRFRSTALLFTQALTLFRSVFPIRKVGEIYCKIYRRRTWIIMNYHWVWHVKVTSTAKQVSSATV